MGVVDDVIGSRSASGHDREGYDGHDDRGHVDTSPFGQGRESDRELLRLPVAEHALPEIRLILRPSYDERVRAGIGLDAEWALAAVPHLMAVETDRQADRLIEASEARELQHGDTLRDRIKCLLSARSQLADVRTL